MAIDINLNYLYIKFIIYYIVLTSVEKDLCKDVEAYVLKVNEKWFVDFTYIKKLKILILPISR